MSTVYKDKLTLVAQLGMSFLPAPGLVLCTCADCRRQCDMGEELPCDQTLAAEQIETWITQSPLCLHMLDLVFHHCFPITFVGIYVLPHQGTIIIIIIVIIIILYLLFRTITPLYTCIQMFPNYIELKFVNKISAN